MGEQRVQRHPALAIPFGARDLRAAQTAGAVDADTLGAETHRRLHRTLHRTAEGDATFELIGNALADQLGVDLGFRISTMFSDKSLPVRFPSFLRSFLVSAPFFPMMTPGRAA